MSIIAADIQSAISLTTSNMARGSGDDPRQRILLNPLGVDRLELICANDTTETTVSIKGTVEAGVAMASQFCQLVQTLAADASIKLTPGAGDKCKVRAGRSQFTFPSLAPKNFPRFVEESGAAVAEFAVNSATLSKAIGLARMGLGKADVTQPFSGGILLKATPNGVFLSATNRFKFVLVAIAGGTGEGGKIVEGIIPEMGMTQIERLAKSQSEDGATVKLRLGKTQLLATAGNGSVRSRLISAKFPDTAFLSAIKAQQTLSVSRAALGAILKRVGLFVTEKAPFVSLKLEAGRLTCAATSTAGDSNEGLDVDAAEGATAELSVNISYLAAVLDGMPADKVDLDFTPQLLRVRGKGTSHNAVAVVAKFNA